MSIIESIRRMFYNYGTSSVPSYKLCSCSKTLKNGNKGNNYTRKQRRIGRRRNKRRNRI